MARRPRTHWLLLCLLISPLAIHAEVGNRSPEQLRSAASTIITGTVQRIYEVVEVGEGFETRDRVAEIAVQSTDKGEEVAALVYVRYGSRRWIAETAPPATGYGHRGLPAKGDVVQVFLTRAEDGGFDVVYPNGFQAPR